MINRFRVIGLFYSRLLKIRIVIRVNSFVSFYRESISDTINENSQTRMIFIKLMFDVWFFCVVKFTFASNSSVQRWLMYTIYSLRRRVNATDMSCKCDRHVVLRKIPHGYPFVTYGHLTWFNSDNAFALVNHRSLVVLHFAK